MSAALPSALLRLTCRPNLTEGAYAFLYEIENEGPAEAFVMHATKSVDPVTHTGRPNDQAAVVILASDDAALVGKFIAPLPTDRRVAVPVIPLARRLAPGARLQAELKIVAPLAETSPYFPDLTLRRYEIMTVHAVAFTIGYWVTGVDQLVATPTEYAPDLFAVVTRNTLGSALGITQRFPTRGIQFFKRTDAFPRQL